MKKCVFWSSEFAPNRVWQTHCTPACRIEEKKAEQRAARRLWWAAGRPSEDEVSTMAEAAE